MKSPWFFRSGAVRPGGVLISAVCLLDATLVALPAQAFDYVRSGGQIVHDLTDPESLYPDWGCEDDSDEDGNPIQRCGRGKFSHDCYYIQDPQTGLDDVEQCEDSFSLDPFYDDKDAFSESSEHLSFSASWNGTPLAQDATTSVALATTGTLTWAIADNPSHPFKSSSLWPDTEEDILSHAVLNMDIYKGEVGSSTLIFSETVPYGQTPAFQISFPDAGHYVFAYSATYPDGTYPPGMHVEERCAGAVGDFCPVPRYPLTGFRAFMTLGHVLDDNNLSAEFARPAAYGALEVNVENGAPVAAASNVLFLPGIEGSRLYDADGEKLWEPVDTSHFLQGDGHVRELSLDEDGNSIREDVVTKEGDVIDAAGGSDFYGSFLNALTAWKVDGTIKDWKAVPYDWRLSLDDILSGGTDTNAKISYISEADEPYIEKTLRDLAATSASGKVTIVAHSNGGLVAKALLQRLGDRAPVLVDKLILVAVPQAGAPMAVGGLLYGYDQGISVYGIPLVHASTVRTFAENAPMLYHLLPSQAYFDAVPDPLHSVVEFTDQSSYKKERAAYGFLIDGWDKLADFLLDKDGGRTQPAPNDLNHAAIANPTLITYGKTEHDTLDGWTPPTGISVDEIAGWGVDTVAGVQFYDEPIAEGLFGFRPMYRPLFTEDGDGTVPVPSALLMRSADNVKRYWVNLSQYNKHNGARNHGSILGITELQDLIKDQLENKAQLPNFFSLGSPLSDDSNKELHFFLHSPLSLDLYDENGNHTGLASDGSLEEQVPRSEYGEFGEVKYIGVPTGGDYKLSMKGQNSGTFSLDIQESADDFSTTTTIANVPTTQNTLATLKISDGVSNASALEVDEDGNGVNDFSITPEVGQIVSYMASVPASATGQSFDQNLSTSGPHRASSLSKVSGQKMPPPVVTIPTIPVPVKIAATIQHRKTTVPASRTIFLSNPRIASQASTQTYNSQIAAAYAISSHDQWIQSLFRAVYDFCYEVIRGISRLLSFL